jgi:hypothetical protein
MKVIALDPGGTTGWATYDGNEYKCGQLGPEEHHQQLYGLLEFMETDPDFIVVTESFQYRQGKWRPNVSLMSREYIGVTKLFCANNVHDYVEQTAAQAKALVTDDKVKAMGLWHTGWPHAMDATRHLLFYLVTQCDGRKILEAWRKS